MHWTRVFEKPESLQICRAHSTMFGSSLEEFSTSQKKTREEMSSQKRSGGSSGQLQMSCFATAGPAGGADAEAAAATAAMAAPAAGVTTAATAAGVTTYSSYSCYSSSATDSLQQVIDLMKEDEDDDF